MKTKSPLLRLDRLLLAFAAAALFAAMPEAKAQYQVTTLGTAVVENFNGMQVPTATSGVTNINFNAALGDTTIAQRNSAWSLTSSAGRGNDTGTNLSGGWRAYGNTTTTTDKALGALGNGSLTSLNATATYVNATGSTVTSFVLSYTGEQWRGNTGPGSITVQYSINGGTFTALNTSTFNATNTTNGAMNGDAAANQTTGLGANVTGISLENGQNIQFRFLFTIGTSSKGVAIDDVSVTFNGTPAPSGDNLYWTANGTALGGAGTWNTTGSNWSASDTSVSGAAWDSSKTAIFAGSSGAAVTVDTVGANGGVRFSTAGYTLSSGTITLGGADIASNSITTDANVSATIGSKLSGTTGMTKAGAGTLTLTGANDYTGGTVVSAGRLIGDTTSLQGAITNNAAVTFSQSSDGTYLSAMAGTGSLAKAGSGTVTLSGTVASASVDVAEGAFTAGSAGRFTGTPTVTVSNGAALNLVGSETLGSLAGAGSVSNTTGTLTVGGNNSSTTFGGVISGAGALTKAGTGVFTISGANTLSGLVTVSAGTLSLSNANALQNATLDTGTSGTQAVTFTLAGNNTYNIGGLQGADALAIGGNTLSIGANNASTTFSAVISGTGGGLTKVGNGTLTLSGANSYTGATAINQGAIRATIAGALGGTATNTVVADGAAFELAGGFSLSAEPITVSGAGISSGGVIRNISGSNTITGVITLAANSRINSDADFLVFNPSGDVDAITGNFNLSLGGAGNFIFSDRIAIGTGVLTKEGAGALTILSPATHSGGTILSAGTIRLGSTTNNALGTGTVALNGGILSGNNTVERTLTNSVTIGGNVGFGDGVATGAIVLSGPVNLGSAIRTLDVSNTTTLSGAVGSGGITKAGAGTLNLSGNNTYDGGTTLNAGVLRIRSTTGAGTGTITQLNGSSQLDIDVAGTVANDLDVYLVDFLQSAELSGDITVNGTIFDAGLNVRGTNSGLISGTGGLTKTGLGTVILSGNNTYSGATAVNGGRLIVNGSQSSSAVTVNSAGSLGGTGTVGGLTVSGVLAPGNSIGQLNAGSTIFDTNGVFELEISDFGGSAGSAWDLLAITGDLTLSNTALNPFTINLVSMTNGTTPGFATFDPNVSYTNTFVTFTGDLLGSTFNTNLFSINTSSFSNSITLNGAFSITNVTGGLALLYSTFFVPVSDYTWVEGSGLWSDVANWTNSAEPGENGAIIFAGAGGDSTNDLVNSVASLTFSNTAGSYTLSGNAITNGVLGVVNNSANAQTINNDIVLGGAQTFDAAAGDLTFGGGIDNAGFLLTVNGAANVALNGSISNTGGITMAGAGSLTLGGNNTFSGTLAANTGTVIVSGTQATAAINVAGGTLRLGANNVLSDSTALTFSTGTVDFGGFSDTVSTFNQSGGVFTNGTLTATTYGLSGGTVGGTLGSTGTANVTGAVSLSGAIESTLNVNSGGTLTLASNDRIGNSSAVTVNAGTLATVTFNDTIGSLVLTNNGSITGSGKITAATYTLNGGTVGANLGTGTATSSASTTTLNGTLDGDLAVSGGTVNLGAADRIGATANVTVSSGTLGISTFTDTVETFTITGGTLGGTTGTLTADTYALQGGTLSANLGAGTATVTAGTTALNGTLGAGTVNIDSGTLNLGSANRLSDSAAVTLNGGTLGISALTDTVGSFTITGGTLGGSTGTLTATTYALNGGTLTANLGTGTATATSGTTALNGTLGATTVTINGGTVNLGSAGRLSDSAALTISSGTLGISTFNDTVGSLVLSGGTLDGTTGILTAGTYALQSGTINARLGAGAITVTSGTTTLGSAGRLTNTATLAVNSGQLTLAGTETVSTYTQTGGTLGGSGQTLVATTYGLQGGTVDANLGSGTINVSGNTALNGTAAATTVNVSGSTLTLGSAGRLAAGATVTVTNSGTLSIAGAETVSALVLSNGTLGGSGQTLTAATYALNGGTVAANLGTGTATASSGTTALDGTLAGNLNVNGGTVNLGSSDRLGNSSTVTVNSGTLAVGANTDTVGTLAVNGGTVSGAGTITATAFTAQGGTIETALAGTGATFSKSGAGSVTLSGANTFDGGTTISGGAVIAANADALGGGSISITGDGASLLASDSISIANNIVASALAYGGVIISEYVEGSGNNKFIEIYNGTGAAINLSDYRIALYINGTNAPSNIQNLGSLTGGPSTLAHGQTLVLTNSGAALALPVGVTGYGSAVTGFNGDDAVALQLTNGTNIDIFGVIGNDPGLAWTNGTLSTVDQTLARNSSVLFGVSNNPTGTGPDAFTTLGTQWTGFPQNTVTNLGSHTMDFLPGTVTIGSQTENATVTYSGTVTLNSSAILTAATGGSTIFSGEISGTNGVTKTGAGTVTFVAANTYSGGTTISSGFLSVGNGGTSGSITGPITNNAALGFNRSDNSSYSGVISGSGTMTKSGAGSLTLSGANSYTGATTVSAGTLELNNTSGQALASTTSISVASGAVLLISQDNQVNNSASVTLSGGTIQRGSGVSEVFGNLNITTASFLDFGTGATGSLTFGTYQDNGTPSALLTLNNFIPGNSFTFVNANFSQGSINSYFTFGDGFVDYSLTNNGGNSFTITAIPEPSTYAAAIGLLGLMLWPSRKRLLKDAKKILGMTPPMRDRLAKRA